MIPDTIGTFVTGKAVNLLNPDPDTIHIEDIAWSLSNVCRWGGHIKRRWTVGAHSIFVAREVEPLGAKLPALLHDATEAYLGDVITPLKKLLPNYKDIENNFLRIVLEKYGALEAWDLHETEIHRADKLMLDREKAALKNCTAPDDLPVWSEEEVRDLFVCNFNAYRNKDLFPLAA